MRQFVLIGCVAGVTASQALAVPVTGGPTIMPAGATTLSTGFTLAGGPAAAVVTVNTYDSTYQIVATNAYRFAADTPPARLDGLGGPIVGVADARADGTLVGYAQRAGGAGRNLGERAVRWDAGATAATELGNLGLSADGQTISRATATNAAGDVVGYAYEYRNGTFFNVTPVRWAAGGTTPTPLQTLGGQGGAYAINASGLAVGGSYGAADGGTRALRWAPGSVTPTTLALLDRTGAANFSSARGVNAAGTTVGFAYKNDSTDAGRPSYHAVRWDAGKTAVTELGTLGRAADGGSYSIADGITDAGTAYGSSTRYAGGVSLGMRAVLWKAGRTDAIEAGLLGTNAAGVSASGISDANAAGQFVGFANFYATPASAAVGHAVMWDADGRVTDLNALLDLGSDWLLTSASSISDAGWVSGVGTFDPDGTGPQAAFTRAYLIRVPEPSGPVFALAGTLAAGFRRKPRG